MAHFIDILPEAGRPGGEGEADVAVGAFGSDSWVVRPREAEMPADELIEAEGLRHQASRSRTPSSVTFHTTSPMGPMMPSG